MSTASAARPAQGQAARPSACAHQTKTTCCAPLKNSPASSSSASMRQRRASRGLRQSATLPMAARRQPRQRRLTERCQPRREFHGSGQRDGQRNGQRNNGGGNGGGQRHGGAPRNASGPHAGGQNAHGQNAHGQNAGQRNAGENRGEGEGRPFGGAPAARDGGNRHAPEAGKRNGPRKDRRPARATMRASTRGKGAPRDAEAAHQRVSQGNYQRRHGCASGGQALCRQAIRSGRSQVWRTNFGRCKRQWRQAGACKRQWQAAPGRCPSAAQQPKAEPPSGPRRRILMAGPDAHSQKGGRKSALFFCASRSFFLTPGQQHLNGVAREAIV